MEKITRNCPYCNGKQDDNKLWDKFMKSSNGIFKIKCKCKKQIGVTRDLLANWVTYKLT